MHWGAGWPPRERPASAASGLEAPSPLIEDLLIRLEKEGKTEVERVLEGGKRGEARVERVRERRKREGRHLNKTRSEECLHDKGACHLPDWCHGAALKPCSPPPLHPRGGVQACLCIQGVISGRDSGPRLQVSGIKGLCTYSQRQAKVYGGGFIISTHCFKHSSKL